MVAEAGLHPTQEEAASNKDVDEQPLAVLPNLQQIQPCIQ